MIYVVHTDDGRSKFMNKSDRLRPNFTVGELACPCCGILKWDTKQGDLIQAIRDWYNQSITVGSHYRCPPRNSNVGGSEKSDHQLGQATDLWINPRNMSKVRLTEFIEFAVKNGAKEIGIYDTKNFVHVSYVGWGTKKWVHNNINFSLYFQDGDKYGLLERYSRG